jgi:hypothetical protein
MFLRISASNVTCIMPTATPFNHVKHSRKNATEINITAATVTDCFPSKNMPPDGSPMTSPEETASCCKLKANINSTIKVNTPIPIAARPHRLAVLHGNAFAHFHCV